MLNAAESILFLPLLLCVHKLAALDARLHYPDIHGRADDGEHQRGNAHRDGQPPAHKTINARAEQQKPAVAQDGEPSLFLLGIYTGIACVIVVIVSRIYFSILPKAGERGAAVSAPSHPADDLYVCGL